MTGSRLILSRRGVIAGASALTLAAPFLAPRFASAQDKPTGEVIKTGWTGTGICLISIPVAHEKGFFTKHGANVELVKFGSTFEQGVEAVSSGKIDNYVNFILQYLKPIEQGVPVKFTGAVHGGCIRILSKTGSEQVDYSTLKGASIGVPTLAHPAQQFLSVELYKAGINPQTEVEWKVYPADLLGEALEKGEVQAVAGTDPVIFVALKKSEGAFTEIGGLFTGQYADLACCAIGVRDEFAANRRGDAAALTRALLEAAQWTHANPDEAAELFTAYSPIDQGTLGELIRTHTHQLNFPAGPKLVEQLTIYGDDLKSVGIIRKRTDRSRRSSPSSERLPRPPP